MNEQRNQLYIQVQRPSDDDKRAWKAYWKEQGQPWRTEPEIDAERQQFLSERSSIIPNIEESIYPFKSTKLSRADVEWLLSTLENGRGPVDWSDESQRERAGLDLRGADLRQADLSSLPLSRMLGGLSNDGWSAATTEQRSEAAVQLERASLYISHLEGACLTGAHLEQADLRRANLIDIDLTGAHLTRAFLQEANLQGAKLYMAHLEEASLPKSVLREAYADGTYLEGANLSGAQLSEASLRGARMMGSNLREARLAGSNLREARLEGSDLSEAQLERTDLRNARLGGANLKNVILSDKRHMGPLVADVQWSDTNLAVVDWSQIYMLGDEYVARHRFSPSGQRKYSGIRLEDYQAAARANRQLSIALQAQGLNDYAARFAYRTQLLQRIISLLQRKVVQYLFSLFLDVLAGYGYKPWRSFSWYLITIFVFALAYSIFGHLALLPDAFVFSLTTLLGRQIFTYRKDSARGV